MCRVEVTGDKVVASITEHADGTIVLKRSDRDFLTDTTILDMNGNISMANTNCPSGARTEGKSTVSPHCKL